MSEDKMNASKAPDSLSDDDLDTVQGGFNTGKMLDEVQARRGGLSGSGAGSNKLKRPGMNMEIVNEDE
ncbi:MAG: hypothetical protein AAGI13_05765 [Pseudomonadota bacterium]